MKIAPNTTHTRTQYQITWNKWMGHKRFIKRKIRNQMSTVQRFRFPFYPPLLMHAYHNKFTCSSENPSIYQFINSIDVLYHLLLLLSELLSIAVFNAIQPSPWVCAFYSVLMLMINYQVLRVNQITNDYFIHVRKFCVIRCEWVSEWVTHKTINCLFLNVLHFEQFIFAPARILPKHIRILWAS